MTMTSEGNKVIIIVWLIRFYYILSLRLNKLPYLPQIVKII